MKTIKAAKLAEAARSAAGALEEHRLSFLTAMPHHSSLSNPSGVEKGVPLSQGAIAQSRTVDMETEDIWRRRGT